MTVPTFGGGPLNMATTRATFSGHMTPPVMSIRRFRTMKEYMSVIRDGLTDWLNSLYNLHLSSDRLVEYLSTGVVLCHHANTWEVQSGTNYRVHFSPRATHGSFQARDNVSLFINWCRRSLHFPETLLFETNDLVEERNEHNFLICLLEVARRSSEVGLPEPVFDLPDMYVEKFATGPLSSIPLSYGDKKIPAAKPSSELETTYQSPQRTVSTDGATGNDVTTTRSNAMTTGKNVTTTGNHVMMVVRDSRGKHTVLRDRTEPVDLQAKNYQLVLADKIPAPEDTRELDSKPHVMLGIPNDMEANPGDVFSKSAEFVAQKPCPVHGRSASFDDVAFGQRQYTLTENTRSSRRWSDEFQKFGRRDSKSPSERVLSRVIAAKGSHQDWAPRRGSLGCSVCPKHTNAEEENLASFWDRLSRPKTRRKSLPSGLPTVSENVTRPRPKSADGRLHVRRGSLTGSGSKEQMSISPKGNTVGTRNSPPSTDHNERPRPRPRSAMGKLEGPVSPSYKPGRPHQFSTSQDKNRTERPRPRPRSAMGKLEGPPPQSANTSRYTKASPDKNESERPMPRARPRSAIGKIESSLSSPQSSKYNTRGSHNYSPSDKCGPELPMSRPRSAMGKMESSISPPQSPKYNRGRQQNVSSSPEKHGSELPMSRPRSALGKMESPISPPQSLNYNRGRLPNGPLSQDRKELEPAVSRSRSEMGKIESPISSPQRLRKKDPPVTGTNVKEKKLDIAVVTTDIRKEMLEEKKGADNVSGRIPLERANSFIIKDKRQENEAFSGERIASQRNVSYLTFDTSKKLPFNDNASPNKTQGRLVSDGSPHTRRSRDHRLSEPFPEYTTSYSATEYWSHELAETQRRRVSDSYAIGRERSELDLEVYEDFLKEVERTKTPPPAVSRSPSPSRRNRHLTKKDTHNGDSHTRHYDICDETHYKEDDQTEEAYNSFSGSTSPDLRRSGLRPCTPVPSEHRLPKTVSPRQDPVPWPPSKIPRPTFYVVPSVDPVSPSACANAKNLQEFLDYLHTSNALQRAESVSSTSDSSEGSTLI